MAQIDFLSTDVQVIIDQMVASYEAMTNRTLQPAQVERLLINAFAYREQILRSQINEAARMNLVAFSRAPFIDYLGELVGVRRLTATQSVVTLRLTLVPGHGYLTIPKGVRIQSIDGAAVFKLDNDTLIAPPDMTVDVAATCIAYGKVGNGYLTNTITIILDPQPYLLSATNIDTTSGGANDETDDELRERIKIAPQSYSTAGSLGSYKYHAMSSNAGIVDVGITSPTPGQVNIYPLMEDGVIPNAQVLQQVSNVCNKDKVRPLTDTVVVLPPSQINYTINVALTLLTGAVATDVIADVTRALTDYTDARKERIGLDIIKGKIKKICMIDSVYDADVLSPVVTQVVNDSEIAICSGITVTVVAYKDE